MSDPTSTNPPPAPAQSGGAPAARPADAEYHREVERLIDEQTALLFTTIQQAAAGPAQVTDRSLAVGSGEAAVTFTVQAITDVPPTADPAAAFPTGQARCLVRADGDLIAQWTLRRLDQSAQSITYVWTHGDPPQPISPADIAAALRGTRQDPPVREPGAAMTTMPLTPDELLSTTRAVRKRLNFNRPVEREVLEQCLALAQQAPSGSNSQGWHFVVVTDAAKRAALADVYRVGWRQYIGAAARQMPDDPVRRATQERVRTSAQYLADHMHEVPVHVIPCIQGRTDGQPAARQAGVWGSIIPAAWSFMLAARARGLGTAWTTLHLIAEEEAARVLDIPYAEIMQVALIPVAYALGTDFKPAPRAPLATMVHWEQW
jgi:nitroreductase